MNSNICSKVHNLFPIGIHENLMSLLPETSRLLLQLIVCPFLPLFELYVSLCCWYEFGIRKAEFLSSKPSGKSICEPNAKICYVYEGQRVVACAAFDIGLVTSWIHTQCSMLANK